MSLTHNGLYFKKFQAIKWIIIHQPLSKDKESFTCATFVILKIKVILLEIIIHVIIQIICQLTLLWITTTVKIKLLQIQISMLSIIYLSIILQLVMLIIMEILTWKTRQWIQVVGLSHTTVTSIMSKIIFLWAFRIYRWSHQFTR